MVEFRKVKRLFRLFILFVRLWLAFLNPFNVFWLDFNIFQIWTIATKVDEMVVPLVEHNSRMSKYQKKLEDLIAELVSTLG